MNSAPTPIDIELNQKARVLKITFDNQKVFELTCEYLRISSPSAEVRGHGGQPPRPQIGKENINIIGIDPVGHYGIKLIFDDGHNTGIYSWEMLYALGTKQQS